MPTEEEMANWQRVIPIMNELLQRKLLVEIAEDKVLVTEIKGPLEEGWQKKVEAFVAGIPLMVEGAGKGQEFEVSHARGR